MIATAAVSKKAVMQMVNRRFDNTFQQASREVLFQNRWNDDRRIRQAHLDRRVESGAHF